MNSNHRFRHSRRFAVAFMSLIAISMTALACVSLPMSQNQQISDRSPVLVELFTSEGCSSCPPADAFLAELVTDQPIDGVEIIALSRHVTYWDYIGHPDPFANAAHDKRQTAYAKAFGENRRYTPQAIVDGRAGVVGSNKDDVRKLIKRAKSKPRLTPEIDFAALDNGRLTGSVAVPDGLPRAEIWLAVAESGLSTSVQRGENAGRTLKHAAVARDVIRIGSVSDGGDSQTIKFDLPMPQVKNMKNARLVIFTQKPGPGAVTAAGSIQLAQ